MAKIFVSYRRQDSPYVALAVKEHLERQFGGGSVFLDIDNIPFGVDFREHTDLEVQRCDVMLVLIGDEWLTVRTGKERNRLFDPQDFVRVEIEAAFRVKIPIIPVLVENAQMPGAADLPESIRDLIYKNAAELRAGRDFDNHMTRLVKSLRQSFQASDAAGPPRPQEAPLPEKPSAVTLSLNSGYKPSVTLTHHGAPTTYRVDGRIVEHVDGTPSPLPAPFGCQLQQPGGVGGWDVVLQDGEWANVILGSFEDVLPASSKGLTPTESWTPVGKMLVVRRGKWGDHVRIPDSGAIVELTIKATPPLADPMGPIRFRVVRNGDTATVTKV